MGVPLTGLELLNKVELMRVQDEFRIQNLPAIQPTVIKPSVVELLAAKTATEPILNQPTQTEIAATESIFNQPAQNWMELPKRREGGVSDVVGGIAEEIASSWVDPVSVVQRNLWPYGMQHWGYEQRREWLNIRFGWSAERLPYAADQLAQAQSLLLQQWIPSRGTQKPF